MADVIRILQTCPPSVVVTGQAKRLRTKPKPSVKRFFRDARKAGERGVVRVSVTDPNGFTVTVSSGGQDQQHAEADAAPNPWDEVSKHATH